MELVSGMFAAEAAMPETYDVEVLGVTYTAHRGVFSPAVRGNSEWFAREVPRKVKGRFLEIGCGIGALAVDMARRGHEVVATDIDARAVLTCAANAARHGVEMGILEGDLFAPLSCVDSFDTIFWNHPWLCEEPPDNEFDYSASYDPGYVTLERFFAGAGRHLNPGGQILLGTGSLSRQDLILEMAMRHGYVAMTMSWGPVKPWVGHPEEVTCIVFGFIRAE